ncbi:MAG: hypothetical protein QOH38_499, partial [Thermoleophilaceae bacterium]|nr:hypothetical protein [Thermoleophilaceae bacterium]
MIPATLPDPSQPSFVLFLAALGAFLGATVGRVRGLERDALRAIVENWTYSFTAVA